MSYNRNRNIIKSKLKFKPNPNYLLHNNIIHYDNKRIAPQLHNPMDKLNKWKISKNLNRQLFIRPSKIELEKKTYLVIEKILTKIVIRLKIFFYISNLFMKIYTVLLLHIYIYYFQILY